MDKELLTKELLLELGDSSKLPLKELEQKIAAVLSLYAVTKSRETLPITGDGSTTKYLLEEFMKDKLSQGKSKGTLEQYFLSVTKLYLFVNKEVNLCKKEDIVAYLNYYRYSSRGRELKQNTISSRYSHLSAFYGWLFINGYIAQNPFDYLSPPKSTIPIKSIITSGEFEQLVIACEKSFEGIRQARSLALISFLIESGVRISELTDLKIGDLDWIKHTVKIRHGKGDKSRITFFGDKSEIRLKEYLQLRTKTSDQDYLFASLNSNESKVAIDVLQNDIREIGKLSNIPRVHPHLFRTTFATNLVARGVPVPTVSNLLGHSSAQTLNHYFMLSEEDMKIAVHNKL